MPETVPVKTKNQSSKDKIIVALDVANAAEAGKIIGEIGGAVGAYKIGLQLFTSEGAKFAAEIVNAGHRVFLDLKFHDIPNTVAKAAVEAAKLGVWMFNIHAVGGGEMMRRTVAEVAEYCEKSNLTAPKIIAVTVLTSANQAVLSETGVDREIGAQVMNLAALAADCGLNGVVASAHEVALIRRTVENSDFTIVTPGIRPEFATNDDQQRVMTPKRAVAEGADYLVIGRPITAAADKLAAVEKIISEIDSPKTF